MGSGTLNNCVSLQVFHDAVCDLLMKGRGKYRNIMITGNANCGKTFLLNPLTHIYNTFCNPASGSFAWVGVENTMYFPERFSVVTLHYIVARLVTTTGRSCGAFTGSKNALCTGHFTK